MSEVRTLKGLLLEMNLEQDYEVKKACEEQILNMYDKLEARCKELEFDSNVQIELGTELVKNLEEENRILKAKLEKALECVDFYADVDNWESPHQINDPNHKAARIKKELDSVTAESITEESK